MASKSDSENDSICTDSTVEVKPDDNQTYEINQILDELVEEDGNLLYLIDWKGYDLVESTWEPMGNIESETTIREWEKKKKRVKNGLEPPFDNDALNERKMLCMKAKAETKSIRRHKRAERRARAISMSSSQPDRHAATQISPAMETQRQVDTEEPKNTMGKVRESDERVEVEESYVRSLAKEITQQFTGNGNIDVSEPGLNNDLLLGQPLAKSGARPRVDNFELAGRVSADAGPDPRPIDFSNRTEYAASRIRKRPNHNQDKMQYLAHKKEKATLAKRIMESEEMVYPPDLASNLPNSKVNHEALLGAADRKSREGHFGTEIFLPSSSTPSSGKRGDGRLVTDTTLSVDVTFGARLSDLLNVTFSDTDKTHPAPWMQSLADRQPVNFSHTCLTRNLRRQFKIESYHRLAKGYLVANVDGAYNISHVSDFLRLNVCVLVLNCPKFAVLVYPSRAEEWKFIDSSSEGQDTFLKYEVFQRGFNINITSNKTTGQLYPLAVTHKNSSEMFLATKIFELDYERLITNFNDNANYHNYFLLFSNRASITIEFLSCLLRENDSKAKIFTCQQKGSWDYFLSRNGGAIILHTSLLPNLHKIPRLLEPINMGIKAEYWAFGDGSAMTSHYLPFQCNSGLSVGHPSIYKLFPYGRVVFLTPSFVDRQPKSTNQFLEWFRKKASSSTPGTWKLVGCHGLRGFLWDIALKRATERQNILSGSEPERESFATSAGLGLEDCEMRFLNCALLQDMTSDEALRGDCNSMDEDIRSGLGGPVFYADENIDPNDEKSLVTWFAGWAIRHIGVCRSFLVLGTDGKSTTARSIDEKFQRQHVFEANFEPTTVWYKNHKEVGEGWEHIDVLGWGAFSKRVGMSGGE